MDPRVPAEDLKRDLRLKKANDLVIAEAKVGKAKKAAAKKTKKEDDGEGAEAEEKPKKTTSRKKKAEDAEEPKAE